MESQKQNGVTKQETNGVVPQETSPKLADRISTLLGGPDEILMANNSGDMTTVNAVAA